MDVIIGLVYAALGAAAVGALAAAAAVVLRRRAASPAKTEPRSRVPTLRALLIGVNGALLIALYSIALAWPPWGRWPFVIIGLAGLTILALVVMMLCFMPRAAERLGGEGLLIAGLLSNATSIALGWVAILGLSGA